MSVLIFLSLTNIKPQDPFSKAQNKPMRIHDILEFIKNFYNKEYAENTRETIRKNNLHLWLENNPPIVIKNADDPNRPTNSGKTNYRLTDKVISLVKHLENEEEYKELLSQIKNINEETIISPDIKEIEIYIEGKKFKLSPGKHNSLQRLVLEDFRKNFAPNTKIVYIGDTSNKMLYKNEKILKKLNLTLSEHDKLPDIILYDEEKNWLYLIEAVTSHGPIDEKRLKQLQNKFSKINTGKIYITAFLNKKDFRKFSEDLAWETEIWIAEEPKHLIHFNGDKFIGPR